MKRRILSALAITVLVLSSITTADAAERKKPTWLASCPEVIDATPQLSTPKTMFLKSPSGQKFKLLEKDSVEFVREPQSIIGCYVFEENIINSNTSPPWQIGVVNRDLQGYYFKNQAGIVWRLTFNPKNLTLETAPGSTYYSPGAGFILDPVPQVASSLPVKTSTTPSAIKVGGSCPKIGQGQQVGTKVLICAKTKGKNLWRDATAAEKKAYLTIITPLPTVKPTLEPSVKPSATPTPTPTVAPITSATTGVANIRASAIANNTFYLDRGNCHSRGINAELQALEGATWKRLIGAMGWDEASNCDAAHPVQPWTAFDVPSGTTLRWRFWLTGMFDLNSATFMSLTKKTQASTPLPTVSPSPTPTVSIKPTPTSTAAPVPTLAPTPTAVPTLKPSTTPSPTSTAAPVPTLAPTPTAVPTLKPSTTPSPTSTAAPVPTLAPTPVALNQEALIISNTNLKGEVGVAVLLGTRGGSGNGEVVFKAEGANCFINGNSLLASLGTNCTVIATKAASYGYNLATSAPVIFNFPSAAQSSFEITTGQVSFGTVGVALSLATRGGSGSGGVSFSTSTPNCSINDNLLLAITEATCIVTATKAASPGFNPITSVEKPFVFKAPVQVLTINNVNLTNYAGGGVFIRTSGGEGSGAVSISAEGPYCTVSGSTVNNLYANSCLVTATKAASPGFAASVSAPVRFMFVRADQEIYICNDVTTGYANSSPINLCAKNTKPLVGYGFNGSYSFSTSDVDCKIVGRELTASAGTTCNVIARVSGSDSYNGAQSPSVSFVFSKLKGQVEILNTIRTAPLGSTITLTANKFFRGPDATFSTTSSNCSINGNILSATIATTCAVQAFMASSKAVEYFPSLIANFTFVKP